uniref:Paired domain-containing protein n=1 Tax=Oncorhynchus tshawytscha TaxID=74940 RepID=A0AAZ3PTS2_ONCTS
MTSFESIGVVPVDVFQGLPSNSVPLCLTLWEYLKKDFRIFFVISKSLKVPRSSVQTIVRKYKHHGTTQQSYRSGRRHVLSPRDGCTLVRKVQINPITTAKDLVKMLEETGAVVSG